MHLRSSLDTSQKWAKAQENLFFFFFLFPADFDALREALLVSAVSKFRGFTKMTYWRILVLAVMIYQGFR